MGSGWPGKTLFVSLFKNIRGCACSRMDRRQEGANAESSFSRKARGGSSSETPFADPLCWPSSPDPRDSPPWLRPLWPWALPAASPCPEPPRRHGPAPHPAPLQEPRTDLQGCSAQPLRLNFFLLLLATVEALQGHCKARGWRHAGHALFPVMTLPFLDLPRHRPQASSPRKRHLLGQGSPPAFSRSTVLCTRLCLRWRPLPAPPRDGCGEACVRPSCCVSDTLSPRTRLSVRGRPSVDLNMNLEKTNKLQGNNEDGVSGESTHTRYFPANTKVSLTVSGTKDSHTVIENRMSTYQLEITTKRTVLD